MKTKLHTISNALSAGTKLSVMAFMILQTSIVSAQSYIHPNQAGNAGGNTSSPGAGSQVVVSTYLGTASNAASGIQGTIFVADKNGANKFAIADFAGFPGDGSYPFYTTPQQMSDGNLYGTSFIGGSSNLGTVYKYDLSAGPGACGKAVVHNNSIGSSASGAGNYANVNELSDGKLYAAYSYGGNTAGWGQIIRMNKDGSAVEVLKNFNWTSATVPYTLAAQLNAGDGIVPVSATTRYDGAHPYGFVAEGADGKIYGTCVRGGTFDHGVIWRMDKDGSDYEIIHACDSRFLSTRVNGLGIPITSGAWGITIPWGNIAQDQLGRIYFTGYNGGEENFGGLCRVNADGSNVQLLMSGSANNGQHAYRGPLIIDNEVFGTFRVGGGSTAIGVLWKYNMLTNTYTKLKTFENTGGYQDGYDIWAGVAYDGNHLYGTAIAGGGAGNVGTLWKIKPDGTDFLVLHRFAGNPGVDCGGGSAALFSYFPSAERVTFADVSAGCAKTCFETSLPVNLITFDVSNKNDHVLLEWATVSEQNNKGFEIERSTDGMNWAQIGFIGSKSVSGNSDFKQDYIFPDNTALNGRNIYRLKQIDFDGKYAYSPIRTIWLKKSSSISIYPNPVTDKLYLTGLQGDEQIRVYDLLGSLIYHQKAINPTVSISLEAFGSGIYYLHIAAVNGTVATHKIVKSR